MGAMTAAERARKYHATPKGKATLARARKKYRATTKGKKATQRAKTSVSGLTTRRSRALRQFYNISMQEYDALHAAQGGHCALCPATTSDRSGRSLHVDHEHISGRVRGLLCAKCNTALGGLGDNEEGLARALAYVRERS